MSIVLVFVPRIFGLVWRHFLVQLEDILAFTGWMSDAAKHSSMHRKAPRTKKYPV